MLELDTLGGSESYACGINDVGQVIGGSFKYVIMAITPFFGKMV